MRSHWSINRRKWTHLSNQRVARCHHVTGKIYLKKYPPGTKSAALRSVLTRRQQIHLTNIFHVFGNRHRQKWRKDKNLLTVYDFKRSESEEAKNQTQSDVPLARTGFSLKLKMLLRYQRRMTIAFCCCLSRAVTERGGKRNVVDDGNSKMS